MKIFRAEPSHWYRFGDAQIALVDSLFVDREAQRPNFNRRMFDEDFSNLFLWRNRQDGKSLFDVASNDDKLTQKILGGIETGYSRRSVDEKICELIQDVARSLIYCGRAFYYLYDNLETDESHLAPISSRGIVRIFGKHFQWVPKRVERHCDKNDQKIAREIRILNTDKLMRFDISKSIKRMLAPQNKTLATIDKHHWEASNFHPRPTHENPNPTNYFDFSVWNETQEHALYRATRDTGWNGRNSDSSRRSDFFDCHRLIRFRRNQLFLRNDILKQLSGEFSRLGRCYKANYFVSISGTDELMSVPRLNDFEVKLTQEEIGFTEIIDYCFNR